MNRVCDRRVLIFGFAVASCGPVGGGDSDLWAPGHDLGGSVPQGLSAGAPTSGSPTPTGTTAPPSPGGTAPAPTGTGTVGQPTGTSTAPTPTAPSPTAPAPTPTDTAPAPTGTTPPPDPTTVPPAPPSTCAFQFDVTTVPYGGTYSPSNVGAIWIQDSGGKFVKSLNVWGISSHNSIQQAVQWISVSGGTSVPNATVDAVTGASRSNAGPISGKWDCTDTSHAPVAGGAYQACIEVEENDILPFFGPPAHFLCTAFNVGSGPVSLNPSDQSPFTQMHLSLQ